ncbi:MAG: DUF882 domain-containing protein [Deltaproteobacteria bacterium]|nr:DUF882 domain-containing protein [Deltaproteobacteria bacterium]
MTAAPPIGYREGPTVLPRALLYLALALVFPGLAGAQRPTRHVYVVARGDTISSIAQRLGIPAVRIAGRNHLQAPYRLRTGQRLRLPPDVAVPTDVPGVQPAGAPTPTVTTAPRSAAPARPARPERPTARAATRPDTRAPAPTGSRGGSGTRAVPGSRWGRPRHPGQVSLVREYNGERLTVNLRRPSASALRRVRWFLRHPDGATRAMDPRLLRQLAAVSDHFGGRAVRVISGFRPFRRGQWTPHSNHNIGRAIDFRVEGVPNRVARDFCRTLPATGCGYYPRSVFIHMDTRSESAQWVDWSRPGERPRYGTERAPPPDAPASTGAAPQPATPETHDHGSADEGLDDVATEAPGLRGATPSPEDENPEPPGAVTSP